MIKEMPITSTALIIDHSIPDPFLRLIVNKLTPPSPYS